jgi:pheromone shutdown-related protein TraB
MDQQPSLLPSSIQRVNLEDKTVYLLGTAHVSQKSVQEVRTTIETLRPDTVAIELCPSRYQALINKDAWKKMNIFQVIKEQKALFLLIQLIMTAFYKKIGEKLGVQPGAEMMEGITQAQKYGAQLTLADREVNITLQRVWGYLSVWQKMKMVLQLIFSLFARESIEEEDIERLKNKDQLEVVMETVAQRFPEVKKRLIDERDVFLAQKIREAPGETIVGIVGAGHVPGIIDHIQKDNNIEPLLTRPSRSKILVIVKWLIPVIIVSLIIYGFIQGGAESSLESISIWILVNGLFSSLGVALALAHPVTIVSAFVAAPLTSLNPTIAAGWVTGIVQAWIKKPTVADLEDLPQAVMSLRSFWKNPLCRILLVVVLANLGSSLGTFVAGSWIAARLL